MMSYAGTRRFVFAGLSLQVLAAAAIAYSGNMVAEDMNGGALTVAGGAFAGACLAALLAGRLPARLTIRGSSALRRFAILSLAFTLIGTSEEIIWRGFGFDTLLRHGAFPALILTTAGFAAMHAIGQSAAGIRTHFVTGFVFGLLRLLSGSLTASIVAHIIYNEMVLLQRMHDHPERRFEQC